uniref:ZP domain-containing protein n=1 Tax=Romanomermis culicivorax TaxID=13658 RepID=A0A915IKF9_ROMCU
MDVSWRIAMEAGATFINRSWIAKRLKISTYWITMNWKKSVDQRLVSAGGRLFELSKYIWTTTRRQGRPLFDVLHSQRIGGGKTSDDSGNILNERSAFCDENRIYFTLLFERPFAGVIYTFGEYPNQKCTYADGRRSSAIRYNLTIPLDDCSSVRFANGSRQNTVIVQRDPNILQSHDRLYIITCSTQNSQQSDKSANYYYAGGYGVNK